LLCFVISVCSSLSCAHLFFFLVLSVFSSFVCFVFLHVSFFPCESAHRQGGLGMPDRDYYLSKDAKLVETKAAYEKHLANVLTLAGEPPVGEPVLSAFQTTAGRPDPYDPSAPLELAESVTLIAHVSKGTYIRSLARDIAYALGTCGHVTYLRRTKAGPFTQAQAISLDLLEETAKGRGLEDLLLPLEAGLDDIPALHLDQTSAQAVRQGRVLSGMPQSSGLYLAKLGAVPVALMEITDGTATVVRGFNLPDVAE
jgi:hypothetical protein